MKNFTCKISSKEKLYKRYNTSNYTRKILPIFYITLFGILLKSINHVIYMKNKPLAILITLSFIVCVIFVTLKWMIKVKAPKIANAP